MHIRLPPFDELVELARNRPEEFERLRVALCDAAINEASEALRPQLRGLQFRIDMETRRCRSPLACCVRISAMMHESLARLAAVLNDGPAAARAGGRGGTLPARVIPFRRR